MVNPLIHKSVIFKTLNETAPKMKDMLCARFHFNSLKYRILW